MSEPALPQEILDLITDYVALDGVERLRELSLVSRAHFLHQTQAHLFRHLRIVRQVKEGDRRMTILKNKPSLFHHVKSLHLYFAIPHDMRKLGDGSETAEQREERLGTILEVLNHLTGGVRSATFMLNAHNGIYWSDYAKSPMALAIARRFFSFPLENLWISGAKQFPLSLLHALPHLQSLKIDRGASFSDDSQVGRHGGKASAVAESTGPGCLWNLKSLYSPEASLDSVEVLFKTVKEPLCTSLVNLNLSIRSFQHHKLAWSILAESGRANGSALETLGLDYSASAMIQEPTELITDCLEDIEETKKTLPPSPLRVFELSLGTRSPSIDSIRVPNAIISALYTMLGGHQVRPALELVRITLRWPFWSDPTGLLTSESISTVEAQRTWGPLDEIWSNAQLYPSLRALGITLTLWPTPSAATLRVDSAKLSEITEDECRAGLLGTVGRGVELMMGLSEFRDNLPPMFEREELRTGFRFYTFQPEFSNL